MQLQLDILPPLNWLDFCFKKALSLPSYSVLILTAIESTVFCVHSLLPLFCLSTQSCNLAALTCYCKSYLHACMQSSIVNSYIQCAWGGGGCNHHRGISTLVLLIVYGHCYEHLALVVVLLCYYVGVFSIASSTAAAVLSLKFLPQINIGYSVIAQPHTTPQTSLILSCICIVIR